MAAVLDALADYVKELIMNVIREGVDTLLGVSGEIKKLGDNVGNLKAYVADAERRRIDDPRVLGWVSKLKGAMYDATDILELCQLDAEERRRSRMEDGICKRIKLCLWNPTSDYGMGKRIKELNARLDEIRKDMVDFKFVKLDAYPLRIVPSDATQPSYKVTSLPGVVVGEQIERDTTALVQELLTEEPAIKVVSIVGAGGIGKSTLAKRIFNHDAIQAEFKSKHIWLSVTESYNGDQLLSSAITQAGGGYDPRWDKQVLTKNLTAILSAGKFLLVMDDVWSNIPWADVLEDPLLEAASKQPGSRVIITTRNEGIVRQMGLCNYHQHHVKVMSDEDAWSLLKQQLPGQVVRIDQLQDVGMRIVEKCGGLPLAIKVMGGILRMRNPNQHDWEEVLNDPAWSVAGLPKELDNRIYLSYADLTPQLKQCFLYCLLFPKGTSILMIYALRMWISEGFIQPQEGSSSHNDRLEEVATKYYQELITRNLIEPTPISSITGYECTMHDVIRSFAEFIAREESLVILGNQAVGGHNTSSMRHLSIGPSESVLEWATLQKHKSLRTLILHCRINLQSHDSLSSFSSLRVLWIKYADCDRLIESLYQLRHLRYLQLEKTNISKLPDNIGRLKFLQHMVLDRCSNLDHLPSSITELVHLRTLDIKNLDISLVPKGLGALTNLRKLDGLPVHMDLDGGWCSLEEIASLSQLRGLTLKGLENVSATSFAEKAMISGKRHLSYLRLNCTSSRSFGLGDEIEQKQQVIEEVLDKLCPPNCIENLGMQRYFGRRLPNWMSAPATAAFHSLRFLQFEELSFCTQLPDGLCRLPCLEAFVIKGAPAIKTVGPEFQAPFSLAVGGGATATSAAFPKLRVLVLAGLSEWEEWEWEEQGEDAAADTIAMPSLEELYIKNCKLSRLPPGLANGKRHALRKLYLCEITNITSVENFPYVVDLEVFDCPELKRISGLSKLQKIRILRCPNVEVLEGVPVLDSLELWDGTMKTLPGYLQSVNPRHLKLGCNKKLLDSLVPGSSEWDKISHIKKHNICYLEDEDSEDEDSEDEDLEDED